MYYFVYQVYRQVSLSIYFQHISTHIPNTWIFKFSARSQFLPIYAYNITKEEGYMQIRFCAFLHLNRKQHEATQTDVYLMQEELDLITHGTNQGKVQL